MADSLLYVCMHVDERRDGDLCRERYWISYCSFSFFGVIWFRKENVVV